MHRSSQKGFEAGPKLAKKFSREVKEKPGLGMPRES
jgi:hypothetical protein